MQPLTAHDAAYTFNRVINGDIEQTNYGGYTSNITKAVAQDDTTLVLYVKKPSPIMYHLAVYILPEHIWKKVDEQAGQVLQERAAGRQARRGRWALRAGRAPQG
ncbi:MAG: ABC transporter substrate-binding protein [Candidatus Nanopelagicales bacterium]